MSEARWRVEPVPTLAKFAGALLLALLAVLSWDERQWVVLAGVGALPLAAYGLRDVLAPVRLSADAEGVTVVRGFAGRHRIPWEEVERVEVTERRSHGLRAELLEIDTGESLDLFGRRDLGAPPEEAKDVLLELWASARGEQAER